MQIKHFLMGIIVVLIAVATIDIINIDMKKQYDKIGIHKDGLEGEVKFLGDNFNQTKELVELSDEMYNSLVNRNGTITTTDYINLLFFDGFKLMLHSFSVGIGVFSSMISSLANVLQIPPQILALILCGIIISLIITLIALVINRDI